MKTLFSSDAFKEALRCLNMARNNEHVHLYHKEEQYMLTITKFMMLENTILKRDLSRHDKLYYLGSLSDEERLAIDLLVKYVVDNKEKLVLPKREKTVVFENKLTGLISGDLADVKESLTIINIIRNAFSHGLYRYDFDREMICIDSIYDTSQIPGSNCEDDYHIKVDIPISIIEFFILTFAWVSSIK